MNGMRFYCTLGIKRIKTTPPFDAAKKGILTTAY
jgi:hypothetical protein